MLNRISEPTKSYKSIKNWNEDEKPREKIKNHGSQTLSNAELLAILLREGTKNLSAIDVGNMILDKFGDLNNFSTADLSELIMIKGIGEAKALILLAAVELAKRINSEISPIKTKISTASDVVNYYIKKFKNATYESLLVVILNSANHIIREEVVSKGILNATMAHPREIFRYAIMENAAGIILIHNHPSGICQPSVDDIELTNQVYNSGQIIGIRLIDHIIIGNDSYYSFVSAGKIPSD